MMLDSIIKTAQHIVQWKSNKISHPSDEMLKKFHELMGDELYKIAEGAYQTKKALRLEEIFFSAILLKTWRKEASCFLAKVKNESPVLSAPATQKRF